MNQKIGFFNVWIAAVILSSTFVSHAENPPGHVLVIQEGSYSAEGSEFYGFKTPLAILGDGRAAFMDSFQEGIYVGAEGVWQTLTAEGLAAPGGGTIRNVDYSSAQFTPSGAFVMKARFRRPADTSDIGGIFLHTPGNSFRIAYDGLSAPGGGYFENLYSADTPAVSENGLIAFYSAISGGSGSGVFFAKVIGGTPVVQKIVVAGEDAPDGLGKYQFNTLFDLKAVAVNNSGHVVFTSTPTLGSTSTLFHWDGSQVTVVPNSVWTDSMGLNNAGDIVMRRSSGTGSNIRLTYGNAASTNVVVTAGATAAPGGGTFASVSKPVLSETGQFVFSASTSGGPSSAIYLWTPVGIRLIAQEGASAPGGGTFQSLRNVPVALTSTGIVYFRATTAAIYPGNPRLFMGDGNQLVQVIGRGDKLEEMFVDDVTLADSEYDLAYLPAQSPANDVGQLAYRAVLKMNLNDSASTETVFVYTPPARWWAGGSGDWDTLGNWAFFGFTPSPIRDVVIDPIASAVINGPAADATVRSVVLGDGGLGVTRLELQPGVTLTTTAGVKVRNNGVLGGSGALAGGAVTIAGTHDRSSDSEAQSITGGLTYINTAHLACRLQSDTGDLGRVMATGEVVVEPGAVVDVTLNAPGSTVDLMTSFWDDVHVWRLLTATKVTGAFVVDKVSVDSHGTAVAPAIGAFSLKHSAGAVDLVWTPFQFQPEITGPLDQIVAVGDAVAFNSSGALGNALAYKWLKNGGLIGGAVSPTLALPSAKLTDAASYAVRVTNAAGSATSSPATRLAVVNTQLPPQRIALNGTMKLPVSATAPKGTALEFQWYLDGQPLVDGSLPSGAVVAGATKSLLAISKMTDDEEGSYTCLVKMGGLSLSTQGADVKVVVKPTVAVSSVPPSMISAPLSWTLVADEYPTGFTITGLPSGLRYDSKTGLISGTPNVSGTFAIKVKASNAAGTGLIQEFTLVIDPLPQGVEGAFSAQVGRGAALNGGLGGLLALNVARTGAFTGVLRNGAASHSVKGRLLASPTANPALDLTLARKGQPSLLLHLEFDGGQNALAGTLTDGTDTGAVEGYRKIWSSNSAAAFAGAYNSIVELPSGSENDVSQPLGAGWQQMTIAVSGAAKGSGRTPDGLAYTFSGSLWPDGSLPEFAVLYSGKGSIVGLPKVTSGPTFSDNRVAGWVEQVKAGPTSTKDRTYATGIPLLRRLVDGAPWIKPTAPQPIVLQLPDVPSGATNAAIAFSKGDVESVAQFGGLTQAFRITTKNVAQFAAATAGNPCKVRMTINATNGTFSGAFDLLDAVGGKAVARRVSFAGILLGHRSEGVGYFLLPGLLPSVSSSPILGGRVEFQ